MKTRIILAALALAAFVATAPKPPGLHEWR